MIKTIQPIKQGSSLVRVEVTKEREADDLLPRPTSKGVSATACVAELFWAWARILDLELPENLIGKKYIRLLQEIYLLFKKTDKIKGILSWTYLKNWANLGLFLYISVFWYNKEKYLKYRSCMKRER